MKNLFENKVMQRITNILASLILVFSIVVCITVIATKKSSIGVARLFGYSVLSVQSDSMEPTFFEGDLIIVKRTDTIEKYEYKVGDIVTYTTLDEYGRRIINTHRIHEIVPSDVRVRYITKGDNVDEPDQKRIFVTSILGIYNGSRLSGFGKTFDFMNSATGVMLCVVVPSALIVAWQLVSYLGALANGKKQRRGSGTGVRQVYIPAPNEPLVVEEDEKKTIISDFLTNKSAEEQKKQAIIDEYLRRQKAEEEKKKAIIEEFLEKQRQAEEAKKAESEAEKIKMIISEVLAQQQKVTGAGASESVQQLAEESSETDSNNPPDNGGE